MEETMTLSVIIPVYNEADTIDIVLTSLLKVLPDVHEVIVIDDGSTDGTVKAVEEERKAHPQISLIRLPKNQGKTAALKKGFAASTGEIVIVQDADLEYDPQEIPSVIEPIIFGKADVVYGSRFLVKKAARVLYFRHYIANTLLTFFSNLMTDLNMSDIQTGYKAFRGEIIREMVITSSRFGIEVEATAKVAKLGCRIYEVPISYYGRTYEEGKKISFFDALAAFYYIVRYNIFCSRKASFSRDPLTLVISHRETNQLSTRRAGR